MNRLPLLLVLLLPLACHHQDPRDEHAQRGTETSTMPQNDLATYLEAARAEAERIDPARRAQLEELAAWVRSRHDAGQTAALTFICTHNSRRSHFMQVWAQAAAHHLGVDGVQTFSGGTEVTAFNPRAVAALRRAGFEIDAVPGTGGYDGNVHYEVRGFGGALALRAYSKRYSEAPNPDAAFCAVMACSHADGACPVVEGAVARFAIPYVDPKVSDGTPAESATYDERCRQIAREMVYAFSRVRS